MAQQKAEPADDGLQTRINILENLLKKVVEVHVSTAVHVKSLDEKLTRMEMTAGALSNFIKKMEGMQHAFTNLERGAPLEELATGLTTVRQEVATLKETLAQLMEKGVGATVPAPMVEKLDALSCVPEMFNKFESQQSTLIQVLEKRIDPRLMIYLKPLIEMLEEEGRQAEQMKNAALAKLNDLLNDKPGATNQEISRLLEEVGKEIEQCQAAFERTQQALQMVVTPFQNIGRLFRGNLETMVMAHDLMAQLHADMPRFLAEMRQMHQAHLRAMAAQTISEPVVVDG
ncbi:MAG: hypothetical protein HQM03_06835 [Magnetococcales bacterium]|nr:hypothetical protein [Magnetococcales bacterium]